MLPQYTTLAVVRRALKLSAPRARRLAEEAGAIKLSGRTIRIPLAGLRRRLLDTGSSVESVDTLIAAIEAQS